MVVASPSETRCAQNSVKFPAVVPVVTTKGITRRAFAASSGPPTLIGVPEAKAVVDSADKSPEKVVAAIAKP